MISWKWYLWERVVGTGGALHLPCWVPINEPRAPVLAMPPRAPSVIAAVALYGSGASLGNPTVLLGWPDPRSFRFGPALSVPRPFTGWRASPAHSLTTFAAGSRGWSARCRSLLLKRLQQKLVR